MPDDLAERGLLLEGSGGGVTLTLLFSKYSPKRANSSRRSAEVVVKL